MQADFFTTGQPVVHQLGKDTITEIPAVYPMAEADVYLDSLLRTLPWQQASIRIAGKVIPVPRLQCWVGDPQRQYTYSGIRMTPVAWSGLLTDIRARVEQVSGYRFNAVLANYYRNGSDSVAWHSDNERELGTNPVLASISFGAPRPFDLKHRRDRQQNKIRLTVPAGTLLVMGETLQNNWLHQVPKVKLLELPRVNLTFRHIVD